jgi:hypothetical protein
VHPYSSRAFQWYQEHSAEHCGCPNMTNNQNKQTTFINSHYYFYYDMFKKEQKYDTFEVLSFQL